MCGIVGLLNYGTGSKKFEVMRTQANAFFMTTLLRLSKERGEDATGIATLFQDGKFAGLKIPVAADEFVSRFGDTETDYNGFLKMVAGREVLPKIMIGHCRKSSVGNNSDHNNIHPIKVRNIVGVHNGTLRNHDVIFKNLACGRDGSVDSEGIIRLLHHFTDKGRQPFTVENTLEVTKRLHGSFSVLAFNGNNPDQLIGFRDGRPMDIAFIKPLKMMVICSDRKFITQALWEYNMMVKVHGNPHGFPVLDADDLLFKFLPDNTLILFNLIKKIKANTPIDEMYITESIPNFAVDKMWATTHSAVEPTTLGRANDNWRNKKITPATSKLAAQPANKKLGVVKTADGTKPAGPHKGKAWDKTCNKYRDISADEIDANKELGALEIDEANVSEISKDGKVQSLSGNSSKKEEPPAIPCIDTTETEESIENTDVNLGQAVINELPFDKIDDKNSKEVIVDMKIDIELQKQAEEAVKELYRYTKNADIVLDLDLENADFVDQMEPFALCNRVRIKAFKEGYLCRDAQDIEQPGDYPGKFMSIAKIRRGERSVRLLKSMSGIMARVMHQSTTTSKERVAESIRKAVREAIAKNDELSLKNFDAVFSKGDYRDSQAIKIIREIIKAKEATNEKE